MDYNPTNAENWHASWPYRESSPFHSEPPAFDLENCYPPAHRYHSPPPPPYNMLSQPHLHASPLSYEPYHIWYSAQPYPPHSPESITPSTPLTPRRNKRGQPNENTPRGSTADPEGGDGSPKKKRRYYTIADKLSIVFDAIYDHAGWKFSDFLWHAFQYGRETHRDHSHAGAIEKFLKGRANYTPANIIELWLKHPDGCITSTEPLYALTPAYTEIRPVRQALTAFAAQMVQQRVIEEAEDAVNPENGLHSSRRKVRSAGQAGQEKQRLVWADIGGTTIAEVSDVIRRHQPLTWGLAHAIALRKEKPSKVKAARRRRPPDLVVMQAISALNFSRTNRANRFPMCLGLAFFAISIPYGAFVLGSRLGHMPAYNTVYRALEGLAQHEGQVVKAHGRDPDSVGIIWLDNVQNYLVQRDACVGREDVLNIGIAATYVELPHCTPTTVDLDDKRRRIRENQRSNLTVEQLIDLVDVKHREAVGSLQWLRVLTSYVPELNQYKGRVSELYRTRAAKQPLPVQASRVHPLATSGKNETVTTELKDALLDFLEQAGQTPEDFKKRLFMMGGDGLTYEKIVQLKNYLQFHENELESLELIQPVLALWHTAWADLSRIFETHWGAATPSKDPSTLSHSALKIDRRPPPNLKKVDFNAGADLLYLVLDARMLDCWRLRTSLRHLASLGKSGKLPTFEELDEASKKLYRAYSSHRATKRAMYSPDPSRIPATMENGKPTVPVGAPWVPTTSPGPPTCTANVSASSSSDSAPLAPGLTTKSSESSRVSESASTTKATQDADPPNQARVQKRGQKRRTKKGRGNPRNQRSPSEEIVPLPIPSRSCEMRGFPMMLFTFSGSSHSKYTTYVLEFICALEPESSKELREAILSTLVVNLTGERGRFAPGDLMQEYFNRLLKAIAEHKGIEYDDPFIHDILSRNLHHLARLQDSLKEGLGLAECAGRHSAPHTNPELRILLGVYREEGLHTRREGRHYVGPTEPSSPHDPARDDYRRGLRNLRNGKLSRWIKESVFLRSGRGPTDSPSSGIQPSDAAPSDVEDDGLDTEETDTSPPHACSLPVARIINDDLVLDSIDIPAEAQSILAELMDDDGEDDILEDDVD
ncbi:hypothetical protein NUW54_g5764 [Trametes sanguinea]|uniref:Uncharacterized protein n=1 Tax=Trametes sanguinea TaxID=158606 RepID=A0ACC1PV71_9APHY|nr:hypothetical protein NUW54_g5764 [Trametes sanguinea]